MVQNFHLPPQGFGAGSQPEDDAALYMEMPQEMRTYAPHIPEAEGHNAAAGMALLGQIAEACQRVADGAAPESVDLSRLPEADRALIAEVLGEGEVSVRMRGIPAVAAQESVFAGVWCLQG
ncbi:MAG: hydrogenase expression/formation C-terminal domain-containing protein, partial [Pseudomonadota bacterium]